MPSASLELKEIERAILSSIFFYYKDVESSVDIEGTPYHFFITKEGQRIFQSLKESERGETGYDLVSVSSTLKRICISKKELEICELYLSNLSPNFQYYSIKENWQRLRAHRIKLEADKLAQKILNTYTNYQLIDDQMAQWGSAMSNITVS